MVRSSHLTLSIGSLAALTLVAACDATPTLPGAERPPAAVVQQRGAPPSIANPTGERVLGHSVLEPGYDAVTGKLIYMLTPENAPFPTHANAHAVAPLWMVVYPPQSSVASASYHLSCEGVPGNCPDHSGLVAGIATRFDPTVYGADSTAIPGHDHIFAAPGPYGDFNIAWELHVVAFTPQAETDGAIDTHMTTEAQIEAAVAAGDVEDFDLGVSINCSVVSPATYAKGTPVSGG